MVDTMQNAVSDSGFMEGVPKINIAALLMPPIWGPANGLWITILYYPLWLFTDNLIYAAYSEQTPLGIALSIVVVVILLAVTIVFAWKSQPYALARALADGKTKEWYLKRQRVWAVGMAVVAIAFLAFATYYNLAIRPTL